MMKILSAKRSGFDSSGNRSTTLPIPESIQKRDAMILRKMHERACRETPLWDVFGGVLRVCDRRYQVMELPSL